MEDKGCYSYGSAVQERHSINSYSFEFQKGSSANKARNQRKALQGSRGKPTPSKWDDAQKWLVGLSGSKDQKQSNNKPRNSNADDRRLLHSLSQRGRDSCSSLDGGLEEHDVVLAAVNSQDEAETKKMDCNEAFWRSSKPPEDTTMMIRSVCLRDMGTEMTPIASKEPSRTATPLRCTTPELRSPISSQTSSPGRSRQATQQHDISHQSGSRNMDRRNDILVHSQATGNGWATAGEGGSADGSKAAEANGPPVQSTHPDSLEARAMAWDEAERAKYMARYKREEVKIQAWENHEKRRAEMEMKRMEVKAEKLKARAQEKISNKLAATRRIAEEKRANAEAKLNDRAAKTSEKADYIRRTGHLPSFFFSLKLPSLCG